MRKNEIRCIISILCLVLLIGGVCFLYDTDYSAAKKLIKAIENNDIAAVERIIEKNPNCINVLPYRGPRGLLAEMHVVVAHPLTKACMVGNVEIIKLLIEKGADVNVNSGMHTPLSVTYRNKHENWHEVSRLLIENGSDINYTTSYYGSYVSCLQDIVQVRPGADSSDYVSDKPDQVQAAFEYALEHCDHSKVNWGYVIQHSVTNDRTDIVKFLLNEGYCDVDERGQDAIEAMTPLMFAARDSTREMVILLLSYGADKTISYQGKTAYDYAVESEKADIITLLA